MTEALRPDDPLAVAATQAIRNDDLEALRQLLQGQSGLASARIRADDGGASGERISRTLLHVATNWPGHFPSAAATIRVLVEAGADVDACNTPGTETPLHWPASSDDVEARSRHRNARSGDRRWHAAR